MYGLQMGFTKQLNLLEFGEKQVAAAFWSGEMEDELRELGQLDFFGKLKEDDDACKVMEEIDRNRAKTVYQHTSEDCSDLCKQRGKKTK
jgi:hypothetical protein